MRRGCPWHNPCPNMIRNWLEWFASDCDEIEIRDAEDPKETGRDECYESLEILES